jgi:UV DNA damage endonuclease
MRVGYACVNTQLPSSSRTLRLANLTDARLRELIAANLDALESILQWNLEHDIRVFRLTSNLIPFGSHAANALRWSEEFAPSLRELGALMRGMSISTHPGQYTVLSSARPAVVEASIGELAYHDLLLSAFGLDYSHKIVLHVGAGAAAAEVAFDRFAAAFARLPLGAARRLVLENDERWPLAPVLELAQRLRLPVVFDVFHHRLAPSLEGASVRELVLRAAATWRAGDGRQEVHFSTQDPGKRPGAHAETLDAAEFERFADEVADLPIDCIVEVKDKERSALRAQEILRGRG